MEIVDGKLLEVTRAMEKNKAHVEKLRELNAQLMEELPTQVNRELGILREEIVRIDRGGDIHILRETMQVSKDPFLI